MNPSTVCWRPPLDEAIKSTSSAKSRDEIQRPPKWKPSTIWLCLKDFVHKNSEQNQWQKAALLESYTHSDLSDQWAPSSWNICAGTKWLVAMGQTFILLKYLPKDTQKDAFNAFSKSTKVDSLSKLPGTLKYPWENKELFKHSRPRMEYVPPASEVQLTDELPSPGLKCKASQGDWGVWSWTPPTPEFLLQLSHIPDFQTFISLSLNSVR